MDGWRFAAIKWLIFPFSLCLCFKSCSFSNFNIILMFIPAVQDKIKLYCSMSEKHSVRAAKSHESFTTEDNEPVLNTQTCFKLFKPQVNSGNSDFLFHFSHVSWSLLSHRQSSGTAASHHRARDGGSRPHPPHLCLHRSTSTLWRKYARRRCSSWTTRDLWGARGRPLGCLIWWWNPPPSKTFHLLRSPRRNKKTPVWIFRFWLHLNFFK